MKYEATVQLKKSTFNRVNKLLAIQSLSEMTDHELMAAGANTHHCEGIFEAKFEDGSRVTWDLCSGSTISTMLSGTTVAKTTILKTSLLNVRLSYPISVSE